MSDWKNSRLGQKCMTRGTNKVEAEPVRAHIKLCLASGHTLSSIARDADIPVTSVRSLVNRPTVYCWQYVADALLRVTPLEEWEVAGVGRVSSVATLRRLQGIHCEGFHQGFIADRIGMRRPQMYIILDREPATLLGKTEADIQRAVESVTGKNPHDYGLNNNAITRAKNKAKHNGWAPLACWDDDTIRDPDAIPNWTGKCGTWKGYWLHKEDESGLQFPYSVHNGSGYSFACGPCRAARKDHEHRTRWEVSVLALYGIKMPRGAARWDAETEILAKKVIAEHEHEYTRRSRRS